MKINGREIGPNFPPYIVAEMSANHNGDLKRAIQLINEAKAAGAHAVKIQTYTADTITINSGFEDFKITQGLWKNRTLYDLYDWAHTPWDWHKALFEHAKEIGITIFSTPFDSTAVDFLEELGAPAYKIASFEIIDHRLLEYIAKTGKPIIMSTGMASFAEIEDAVNIIKTNGCHDLTLLHCVSAYPAPVDEVNLRVISDLSNKFKLCVGLSDHSLENDVAVASVAMGACLIEKHFTLDQNGGGPDDSFSLEPAGLEKLVSSTKTAWLALGAVTYEQQESEKTNLKFRRSLYFVRNLQLGDTISEGDIRSIRPGFGLSPKYYEQVIGCKVTRAIKRGMPVKCEFFE